MTTSSPSGKYEEALRETAPPPHGPTEAVVTVPRKGRRRLVPGTEGEQNADVDTLIQNSQTGDKVSCSPDNKRSLLLVVQVVPRTNNGAVLQSPENIQGFVLSTHHAGFFRLFSGGKQSTH
jgi:hypothetical protein